MIYALLILHGFVTLAMIGIILLQKSDDSGPLGIGGGGNNSLFTARGVANILTRSTAILGALFIGNCILIDRLTSKDLNRAQALFVEGKTQKTAQNDEKSAKKAEKSEKTDEAPKTEQTAESEEATTKAPAEDGPAESSEVKTAEQ